MITITNTMPAALPMLLPAHNADAIRGKKFPGTKLEVETCATPGAAKKFAGFVRTPDGILIAGQSDNERRALSMAFKLADTLNADL